MTPTLATNDSADLLLADAELCGERVLGDAALEVSSTNFFDLGRGKLTHPMSFASVVGENSATLHMSIRVIVSNRAQKPVVVVMARRVVAGVADDHAIWDRADAKFVTNTCGSTELLREDIPDHPVAIRVQSPGPWPAFISISSMPVDHGKVASEGVCVVCTHYTRLPEEHQ